MSVFFPDQVAITVAKRFGKHKVLCVATYKLHGVCSSSSSVTCSAKVVTSIGLRTRMEISSIPIYHFNMKIFYIAIYVAS